MAFEFGDNLLDELPSFDPCGSLGNFEVKISTKPVDIIGCLVFHMGVSNGFGYLST